MKNQLTITILCLPLMLAGCGAANTSQPLAPGFLNTTDQQMGEILTGARSFYSTIQCETQGKNWSSATSQCVADPAITTSLVLTPSVKTAFNDFGVSLNAANAVYLAYHAGTATEAAAQAAVDTVKTKQAALPLPGAN